MSKTTRETKAGIAASENPSIGKKKILFYVLSLLLFFVVVLSYSNHFRNSFHFDDTHVIVNNLYIRDLKNIPLFFKDASDC